MLRLYLLVTFTLLLLAMPLMAQTPPSSEAVGSTPRVATAGEKLLAEAKGLREASGYDSEAQFLLDAFGKGTAGDPALDCVADRLADFAVHKAELREPLLEHCTRDQLLRLLDQSKTRKDFRKQLLFGEEFLRTSATGPQAGPVKFDVARAHMMIDVNEKKAVAMWRELAQAAPDTSAGKMAAIWTEAVEGPQSVPALEASFELGFEQDHSAGNDVRAMLSYSRVVAAGKRDFFQDYLNRSDIRPKDRAEVLYLQIYARMKLVRYDEIPALADRIFSLAGYDELVSRRTAFALADVASLQNRHDDAINGFESYLRAYPKGEDVARATYFVGRSHHYKGDIPGALLYYRMTFETYPDSDDAAHAKVLYESLLDHDRNGAWVADAGRRRPKEVARLKEPLAPSQAWPVSAKKPQEVAKATSRGAEPSTAEVERRFQRLASALGGDSEKPH